MIDAKLDALNRIYTKQMHGERLKRDEQMKLEEYEKELAHKNFMRKAFDIDVEHRLA